jgi:molecular chaperone DnaK
MLTVTATEKSTRLAKSVGIDTAGRHRINLDAARTNLAALFAEQDPVEDELDEDETFEFDPDDGVISLEGGIDPDTGDSASARSVSTAPASLLASAKSLKGRAEKLLESNIPEADAASIRSSLAHIPKAIEDRDWEKLESQLDTLSDLLFYLED